MQADNQVIRLNNFPWIKVIKKKFLKSFPEIKATTLLLLHENISKEFENILTKQNRTRAKEFYRILRNLYLHFYWKTDWSIECHVKSTCVLILYYMSYTGLILGKGNVSSEWFGQTFTALQCFSGDPFLVCDVLLLFQNMKKKYHHAYSEILKSCLFDESLRQPSDSECFVKVMLLFRRLKFLSKGASAKRDVMLYASKVNCPPGVESWLSSLKIKDLCSIKSNKIIQKFLKKDLSCDAIKKLQKILFSNKYNGIFINSLRAASTQQNTTKIKKIEKNFDKNSEKIEAKSNADAYKLEINLNNEINPKRYKNHSDYQCLAKMNFNEKNLTCVSALSENPISLSRMPKRKLSEKEERGKSCLHSISVSQKSKKMKVYNKMNNEYKESNPKHSTLLNGKLSHQSATDSSNKFIEKGEGTTPILIVDGKNVSNETDKKAYSETSDQFFICSSEPEDLKRYPLVSYKIQVEKQKSDNLSISKKSCKSKRVITEICYENNYSNFDIPNASRKDRILEEQRTNKYDEDSLAMPNTEKLLLINSSSSTRLIKNNMDFSDRPNLLSVQLQGQEIRQTDVFQNNLTDIHKNNLEILSKNDHILSSIHNDIRTLTVPPKILNKAESECENKLVNYSSCVSNTELVTSDHSQASITQNKEVQNSAESPVITSPLKSHISQETSGNCFHLYSAENSRNQDTRISSMLSPPLTESFKMVYSSPESLELSIVSGASVSSSIVKSLEQSKSIYTTTDSSLKYTDEDESYVQDKKDTPTKLSQLNSNAITSKISKSKLSTKKSRRKRVKSVKFVESNSSSANESSLKIETPKTTNSPNCEVERFSHVVTSKSNAESFNKRSSSSLSSKNEITMYSSKQHLVDNSEKIKQVLQDLTSKCEIDLLSNHIVEEENRAPCLVHISNPSEVIDKSSEIQSERSKCLSTAEDNVNQSMHLSQSIFADDESSLLLADNSSKTPYPVCTIETSDLLHSTSKAELQKFLPELNNLPFNAQKSVHKQLDYFTDVHQDVLPLGNKLLESFSENKFHNLANKLKTSSPVQVKQVSNSVHNSKGINSDFSPPHPNEQFSQDYEKNIVKVNHSEKPLNNSSTIVPDQGSFPEVQNVQICLSDCLVSQSCPVSRISKIVTENLVSPRKDKNATFDSPLKQKTNGRQKKRKFVFDSDSDAPEDQKSIQDECFSGSKFKKSVDSSEEQKLPCKVKYKRCIIESDSDASIHENGLLNSTVSQASPSEKEIEPKDAILEFSSEDNPDYSECSSPKQTYSEVDPKDFISEYAHEDSDFHSPSSEDSDFHSPSSEDSDFHSPSSEDSDDSFIANSASKDDCDSDESTYLARSSSLQLRSFENDKSENLTIEAKTQGNTRSLLSLSRNPSPELRHSKKEKCKTYISDSSSEDNADQSVCSSKSALPRLKHSSKIKSKRYLLESASEDNPNEPVSPSRNSFSDFIPSSKIKSKTLVLKSASEDSTDNSVVFPRSQSLELKHHNKVKYPSLISTEDNVNLISSPSSHFSALKTSNLIALNDFDSSHSLNTSPVKKNCSKENISELPDCLQHAETILQPGKEVSRSFRKSKYLLRSSSNKKGNEKSFSEIKMSVKANKFEEVDGINSENSLVSMTSRKIKKKSGTKELDKNHVVPLRRRGRRKSKKFISESESDSCENQCEYENKSGDSQNISSKILTASYNHLTNPSRNSNLDSHSVQINCRTKLISSVEGQKNLDVSRIDMHSSTNQAVNEKSFSEIKMSVKANKFKEVDGINSENSLVNLTSRKIRKKSGTKELDENHVVPLKRRGRRKSKKFISESESDSCENQCEYENKSGDSQNISSKILTASYNHLTNPSRNSNLDSHSSTNQAVNKESNVLKKDINNHKSVQRELSFESESSSEDIPLIEIQKKLKTFVNSPVFPENPNSFKKFDKSLLKVSSDCIQNSGNDSYISKHSPSSETSCSVYQKKNTELSKTSQNSSVSQLPDDNDQNTAIISVKGRQELSLKETFSESTSDLLSDEIKKKNPDFVHILQKALELQQNLQLRATKENLPILKQLENPNIGSHLEQSFVNNSNTCTENGNLFPKTSCNLNNLPTSIQESNSSPKGKNGCTGHQLTEIDKNVCDLFFSDKEHLTKDSFHDSNDLSDENFVQTLLDKIDPNILNNEEYLNSFVDNYLVSSNTHTALNENIENSDGLESKSINNNSSLFSSAAPYSNTVNKPNQQNSEPIFNTSNSETFDFHRSERNVIDSKIMEFDAIDAQNIHKNDCLNSSLDSNQTLKENYSQQSPIQYVNNCSNTELEQLDLSITPTEGINITKSSDTFENHLKQNSDSPHNLAPFIKIPTHSTHCTENEKMVKPQFCEMDFTKETSPDRSETLLKDLQKDGSYDSKLNLLNQGHSNNFRVDTLLNTSEKLQIMQAHLNNTTEANEKILFICDIENKTSEVHIMPQQLMPTFLSQMKNVSQNHTLCSNSTKCNCPLCCYSSSPEFKNEELSKDSNKARTEMGHIYVNGVKLSTSSLFPVVALNKNCDDKEIKQNSSGGKDSAISTPNKVSENKRSNIKRKCLVKSNSKRVVPEKNQRKIRETGQNSFSKKENDSAVVKKESIPKRSYNLRSSEKIRYDKKLFQTKKK